jgi:hypothetical protein
VALDAVWWGQEYTIPNPRQLNYAVQLRWSMLGSGLCGEQQSLWRLSNSGTGILACLHFSRLKEKEHRLKPVLPDWRLRLGAAGASLRG